MRKSILFLLLATTSAMPALAQRSDEDRQSRRASQSEKSESRAERSQRAERPQRPERSERAQRQQVQVEQQAHSQGIPSENMQRYQQQMQQRQQRADGSRSERMQRYQQQMQERQPQVAQGDTSREQRIEQWRQRRGAAGPQSGGLVQRDRSIRTVPVVQPEAGQVGPVRTDVVRRIGSDGRYERDGRRYNRDGRYDRDNRHRWTGNWRHDRRYDWRNYRNRHRSIFSLGFYFDPFGFNYRRFGIGSYLYPNYYQSNYWINDPWQYRLPPVYGPYRWVRYHDDAVLIDIYSGEVVDVIYGFFW